MSVINFYCRHCGRNTNHEVASTEQALPNYNFAYLECTKCDTPKFAVRYEKNEPGPTYTSRRVSEILCEDEQPTDICNA